MLYEGKEAVGLVNKIKAVNWSLKLKPPTHAYFPLFVPPTLGLARAC
jgi:hypothetical protein